MYYWLRTRHEDYNLDSPTSQIDFSPPQYFELLFSVTFLRRLLNFLTLQDPWCGIHTDRYLLTQAFEIVCSNFEYNMVCSETGRCIFLELEVVMNLYLAY